MGNPFHEGELEMQFLAGESGGAEMNAAMIAARIARGAFAFLSARQLAVLAVENGDEIWCSPMVGEPGFVSVPEPSLLRISLRKLAAPADSTILAAAERGGLAGSIFIDLETRVRYRINGRLTRFDADNLELQVREAYGNCPKYITRRSVQWDAQRGYGVPSASGQRLPAEQQETLHHADLFFMATGHRERGLDASHRGGYPGFVTVVDESTLLFPDYPGNSLFNSLGNLMVDHRIGLFIPDMVRRRALCITGTATVEVQQSVPEVTTSNAPRRVRVSVSRWNESNLPVSASQVLAYSPFNP